MDGRRIQDYLSSEVDALLKTYEQFEILIPAQTGAGAGHKGEDGRFVEDLLREYLQRHLPKELEILTGFILRPAVKTGKNGKERKAEFDSHSTQIDIIVFDSANYPVFKRFGNSVIVPPEGVVGIISVKKHLYPGDTKKECNALLNAATLCETRSNVPSEKVRGPYLALVSVKSKGITDKSKTLENIFQDVIDAYSGNEKITFDKLVGFIGALDECSIFKVRPRAKSMEAGEESKTIDKANYIGFVHKEGESHLGLQFLLTGILSVFYDETRRNLRRPGYTAFPAGRAEDKKLGPIQCDGLR
jgi:hypothetical protein